MYPAKSAVVIKYIFVRETAGYNAPEIRRRCFVNAPIDEKASAILRTGAPLPAEDAVWTVLQAEAEQARSGEAALAPLYDSILGAPTFESALIETLVARLGHNSIAAPTLRAKFRTAAEADPAIGAAGRADLKAVVERDPASGRLLEPFLFFKGFAAIQTHRFAHWMWANGRPDFARYLQSRSSEVFQTDIHPGAEFGRGLFLDHATGFVAGETVVIEDDVSILHGVTLGGTGNQKKDRHPKVRTGVLIGAGAIILGDIEIGAFSKIASGSFVTQSVPPRCTAVGVPARIIEGAGSTNPAQSMDQHLALGTYESFTYVI
ncbi:serine acetyltransferase [Rhodomicrobium udaipurense JA643]|uniref:Serine acetyltransferase n=1 Tax=Rhodomicrobium udaipurense TaxID=1202716 RepID=A0A8I1GAA3_9HYPH|nr:serine acetyltransferase [Rhodomicrobium udaipurense JA643]MBJ7543408.1 serine O-acetyltransferase [Rhodomicrobium udaipurense]